MGTVVIFKKPIFVDFDRRREVVFNLNTEILIRNAGGKDSSLWDTIGETKDEATGQISRTLDVNVENLRLYLWAALQGDARARGEALTIEDVGALLSRRKWVIPAVRAISEALNQYYGDEPAGETPAPAVSV
jgi:hypothetical protein